MSGISVTLAAEGRIDVAVLQRLVRDENLTIGDIYGGKGKANLDLRLPGFNNAASRAPWVVLRDLDHDAECAATLVRHKLPAPANWMLYRVAVREVEAWLMSDRETLARFYKFPESALPRAPDEVQDAKRVMLEALTRSRSRDVRETMVRVTPGVSASIGPEYNSQLEAFALGDWRPEYARRTSNSLDRACIRLAELAKRIKKEWPRS